MMRYLVAVSGVLALSLVYGCNKPEPASLHVAMPADPPARPMAELKPVEPTLLAPTKPTPAAVEATNISKPTPLVEAAEPKPAPAKLLCQYVIRRKDTLWSIAQKHLGSGRRYTEILAANPGLEAAKLRIGQRINIPAE